MRIKPKTRSLLILFATQKNITKTSNRLKLKQRGKQEVYRRKITRRKDESYKQTVQYTAHKRIDIKLTVK